MLVLRNLDALFDLPPGFYAGGQARKGEPGSCATCLQGCLGCARWQRCTHSPKHRHPCFGTLPSHCCAAPDCTAGRKSQAERDACPLFFPHQRCYFNAGEPRCLRARGCCQVTILEAASPCELLFERPSTPARAELVGWLDRVQQAIKMNTCFAPAAGFFVMAPSAAELARFGALLDAGTVPIGGYAEQDFLNAVYKARHAPMATV